MYCVDCNTEKHNIAVSGSFLCIECQDRMFQRINSKYKEPEEMSKLNIEKVEELMVEGLTAKEIADKTGIPLASVYTNMSTLRKRSEKTNSKHAVKEVKEFERLKAQFKELSKERTDLEERYEKLYRDYLEEQKINKRLVDVINTTEQRNRELQNALKEPAEDTVLLKEYEKERRKHEALLQYLAIN